MNDKHPQLVKAIIRQTIICGIVIAASIGVYFLTDDMVTSSLDTKNAAETDLGQQQSKVTSLDAQVKKAAVAEKRFAALQGDRVSLDYTANTEVLKDWLRHAKEQYRLSNSFKLAITPDKPVDLKELNGTNYAAIEHPAMKLDFSAMSDTHVFSFLDDLLRNSPGIIRIDAVQLRRNGDMDAATAKQMQNGATPYLIDAQIEFNWIGLKAKEDKTPTTPSPATPSAAAAGHP